MTRPIGPAINPISTTSAPLSTRASRAVQATPIRRLARAASAEPTANSPQAAAETGQAAGELLSAAGGLARNGDVLRSEVDNFLGEIRAA